MLIPCACCLWPDPAWCRSAKQRLTRSAGCSRPLAWLSHGAAKACFLCAFVSRFNPVLIAIIEPLLAVWYAIRDQVMMLDRQMLARARNDDVARRLMTIPGVGVVIALAYTAVIDDHALFRRSVSVGAYLGLTPRRYQSGEVDTTGHISKCGDSLLRGD